MRLLIANNTHIPEIETLYQSLFASISELEPYFFKEASQDVSFLEATITNKDSDIIIAVIDDRVVGFALMQIQVTPPYNVYKEHKFAYLIDLITDSDYLGQGIASALLAECETWGKSKGAAYLELSVLNQNANAYKLYLQQGFSEKTTTMYKRLD